jgi:hypothetical protein
MEDGQIGNMDEKRQGFSQLAETFIACGEL